MIKRRQPADLIPPPSANYDVLVTGISDMLG